MLIREQKIVSSMYILLKLLSQESLIAKTHKTKARRNKIPHLISKTTFMGFKVQGASISAVNNNWFSNEHIPYEKLLLQIHKLLSYK